MGKRVIRFKLNGDEREEYVQDNITMVDFLRKADAAYRYKTRL